MLCGFCLEELIPSELCPCKFSSGHFEYYETAVYYVIIDHKYYFYHVQFEKDIVNNSCSIIYDIDNSYHDNRYGTAKVVRVLRLPK